MRTIRDRFLTLALSLALAPVALADDAKKSGEMKDEGPITVHGVISDFTVLGETDVDEATGKVMTAEATLVTIIGHRHHDRSLSTALEKAKKEEVEVKAGKEVGIEDKKGDDREMSGRRNRSRMNLYMVAVSPKTKVCDVNPAGKEVEVKLEELEIGDRVELVFEPKAMSKDDDKSDAKAGTLKHGRHRTYLGTATGIKLMGEPTEGDKK